MGYSEFAFEWLGGGAPWLFESKSLGITHTESLFAGYGGKEQKELQVVRFLLVFVSSFFVVEKSGLVVSQGF